ncbi:MAG: TIGR02710 family CRISPR-associated CARF protein, partial [Acidocella sp.]|nr:TIGR02710 family CRISPR-associated CARF protein [Acidocella sp.]
MNTPTNPPSPKTILFASLGGSPQPVRTCLATVKPDFTVFVATAGSRGSVNTNEIPKSAAPSPSKPLSPNDPPLAVLAGDHEILEVRADEPDSIFSAVQARLTSLKRLHPEAKIIVDYTGGTKSMSAGMVYAAMSVPDIELQFMLGNRPDTTKIEDGTEKPQRMATDLLVAERLIAEAETAMRSFDYQVAVEILKRLLNTAETRKFGDVAWRARLRWRAHFASGLHNWDIFDHTGAQKILISILPEAHPLLKRLGRLCADKKEPEILFDLWLNAQRRASRGRFDDAVARAYRLVEWTAQWRIREELDESTTTFPVEKLPSKYRKEWCLKDQEFIDLPLERAWRVLGGSKKDSHYGPAVKAHIEAMREILKKRNKSILAHGFDPVTQKLWEETVGWIKP